MNRRTSLTPAVINCHSRPKEPRTTHVTMQAARQRGIDEFKPKTEELLKTATYKKGRGDSRVHRLRLSIGLDVDHRYAQYIRST